MMSLSLLTILQKANIVAYDFMNNLQKEASTKSCLQFHGSSNFQENNTLYLKYELCNVKKSNNIPLHELRLSGLFSLTSPKTMKSKEFTEKIEATLQQYNKKCAISDIQGKNIAILCNFDQDFQDVPEQQISNYTLNKITDLIHLSDKLSH